MEQIKNEVATYGKYALANGQEINFTSEVVKKIIAGNNKITKDEISMFFDLCKFQKLNPLIGEAYIVKYGDSSAQMIVAEKSFLRIANNNKYFDGLEDGIIVKNKDGEIKELEGSFMNPDDLLIGAWCTVYRKDRRIPTKSKISYKEFNKGKSTWKVMPALMLNKCARVNALRRAFPDSLGGCYVEDELQATGVIEQEPEIQEQDYDIDEFSEEVGTIDGEILDKEEDKDELVCEKCGRKITEKIRDFSMKKYNKKLCYNCQQEQN